MKLHDLRPAPGSHKPKRRVGRGIAAGQGKTAGRGTKGQKARAGGTIPAWFEGGQTPLHQRLPKLRGFRNMFKIEFEVVNLGDIARLVELGAFEGGAMPGEKAGKGGKAKASTGAPITVNQEILRAAGLVRTLDKPLKVLGTGELSTALFVVADAYSASAKAKIEAAGGSANVLEVPRVPTKALGVAEKAAKAEAPAAPKSEAPAAPKAEAALAPEAESAVDEMSAPADAAAEPAPKARASKAKAAPATQAEPASEAPAATDDAEAAPAKPARRRKAADAASDAGDAG